MDSVRRENSYRLARQAARGIPDGSLNFGRNGSVIGGRGSHGVGSGRRRASPGAASGFRARLGPGRSGLRPSSMRRSAGIKAILVVREVSSAAEPYGRRIDEARRPLARAGGRRFLNLIPCALEIGERIGDVSLELQERLLSGLREFTQ